MPKRTDLKKIMIIGSGPIVIGQAAEFDYAGTQACLALQGGGVRGRSGQLQPRHHHDGYLHRGQGVYGAADAGVCGASILRYERPDAIVPGIGGQTGLNLAMQLEQKGVLKECQRRASGHRAATASSRAEDREQFKELCQSIGEPVIPSQITYNLEEAKAAAAGDRLSGRAAPGVHAGRHGRRLCRRRGGAASSIVQKRLQALARPSGAGGKERQGL